MIVCINVEEVGISFGVVDLIFVLRVLEFRGWF